MRNSTWLIVYLLFKVWYFILGNRLWTTAYCLRNLDVFQIRKMKSLIDDLNKAFENRIRLGIMSVLMVHDWVDFNTLKETLWLTDGNLASHLSALEKIEYLQIRKQFIGKKPNTSYSVTVAGRKAFSDHLDALENLIRKR